MTGLLAIGVLLLITNWLFHQVYWRQWVTTLKAQATDGERTWQLISVGFLVGYREGFETVLFLQSLMLDAGGVAVGIGVAIGCLILLALGYAALKVGMKLPYFKILLITAGMIGVVLITFVGATVRAAQTVGWLPVHRLMPGSWPLWTGNWLGLYNTWETVGHAARDDGACSRHLAAGAGRPSAQTPTAGWNARCITRARIRSPPATRPIAGCSRSRGKDHATHHQSARLRAQRPAVATTIAEAVQSQSAR